LGHDSAVPCSRAASPATTLGSNVSRPQSGDVHLDEPWLSIRWDGEHQCVCDELGGCDKRQTKNQAGTRPKRRP
jgi:hypothetical protein